MLKGFKDFILRGNIVDLAVAVVIGTAFTALVTGFTTSFIDPLLAAAGGTGDLGLGFNIRAGRDNTFVDIGGFITAVINFLIIAAVVYFFVVLPMKKVLERMAPKQTDEAPPAPAEDVILLREIRDLLEGNRDRDAAREGGSHSA
ncbi:large conductance mechanosensitive channel protein MscL [Solicola sp. PLA-1-18]|uniref:large conductance mechanosensitive channel protein MscL n=1 Tax=Solicola sp. PLA-1-18 TaxID=3380532 RepID=UPI003B78C2DC